MYKIFAAILIIILASCAGFHNAWNGKGRAQARFSNFNKALAKEYKDFAKTALDDHMLLDYLHFVEKSAKAAAGDEVTTDDVRKWKLPDAEARHLVWARGRLGSFMVDRVKEKYPAQLAHAQMLYDCWGTRAARKVEPAKTEECRMGFILEMASLENILMPVPGVVKAK